MHSFAQLIEIKCVSICTWKHRHLPTMREEVRLSQFYRPLWFDCDIEVSVFRGWVVKLRSEMFHFSGQDTVSC